MKTLLFLILLTITTTAFSQDFGKVKETGFFHGPSEKIAISAVWAGIITDLATTERGLSTGQFHEANSVVRNRGVRIGIGVGSGVLITFAIMRLENKHPKLAFLIGLFGAGGHGLAAVHNYRVVR